jgi:hypothetical protein
MEVLAKCEEDSKHPILGDGYKRKLEEQRKA